MSTLLKTKFVRALCKWLPTTGTLPQGVKDWLVEYSFARLLGSAWADYAIQHTQYLFVSSFLVELRDLEDFFGLMKAVLPALLYAGLHAASALIKYLRKQHVQRLSSRAV